MDGIGLFVRFVRCFVNLMDRVRFFVGLMVVLR